MTNNDIRDILPQLKEEAARDAKQLDRAQQRSSSSSSSSSRRRRNPSP